MASESSIQAQNQSNRKRGYDAENAAMLFARLLPKHEVDLRNHPIVAESLSAGSVVEIAGPIGSGKTAILVDITARCILSKDEGGLECDVMYVDCDRQFHINRLITVLERTLERNRYYKKSESNDDGQKLTAALERFRYAACDCSDDLLNTFDVLDSVLPTGLASQDQNGGLLLVIDCINAFYWLDRASRARTNVALMQRKYAERLQRFSTEHNAPAVVTKLIMEGPQEDAHNEHGSPKFAASSTMDVSWTKLVTSTVQLLITDVQGKITHKAFRSDSRSINFQPDFHGITYA